MSAHKKIWSSDPFYTNGDPIFPTIREIAEQPLPIKTKTGFRFPQSPSAGADQALRSYILTDMMGKIIPHGVKVQDAVKTANDRIIQVFNQLGVKR